MLVWGGINDEDALNTGGIYDLGTDTWYPLATENAPEARFGHQAVWTGDKLLIWGGFGSTGLPLKTGGLYQPTTNTWHPIPTEGVPDGRVLHTAVWAGDKLLVWGGTNGKVPLNTGAFYLPPP